MEIGIARVLEPDVARLIIKSGRRAPPKLFHLEFGQSPGPKTIHLHGDIDLNSFG
jgi:hypothetical protein